MMSIKRQRQFRFKFGSLDAEKRLDVAHIGINREQPCSQRLVGRHVGHGHHQTKVRAQGSRGSTAVPRCQPRRVPPMRPADGQLAHPSSPPPVRSARDPAPRPVGQHSARPPGVRSVRHPTAAWCGANTSVTSARLPPGPGWCGWRRFAAGSARPSRVQ